MYVKKAFGYLLPQNCHADFFKGLLDTYNPPTLLSNTWKHWVTIPDVKRCIPCKKMHGKIFDMNDTPLSGTTITQELPRTIQAMQAILAGNATQDGENGADWWVKNYGHLPSNYISKDKIGHLGWKWGKDPVKFAPKK